METALDGYSASKVRSACIVLVFSSVTFALLGCAARSPETFFDWGVNEKLDRKTKPHALSKPLVKGDRRSQCRLQFIWPARGPILRPFRSQQPDENAGIDIKLITGADIHASAAGKVSYIGDGLKGYGTVIIVSHSDGYATVYARGIAAAVHLNEVLMGGQVLGYSTDKFGGTLHFEIRKDAKPLDPICYLGEK